MILRYSLLLALAAARPAGAVPLRYNRDVRPVLSDNCFHCHGPDAKTRKADLRLDLREAALTPAKSGKTAIVPGKPEESELVARVFHTDPDELMPPEEAHKVLTPSQKEMLRRWVAEGAVYEAHWAYTPIVRPAVPKPGDKRAVVVNAIDAFVQQPLLEKGIAPSPEADAAILRRRVSLDLTGLPPAAGAVAVPYAEEVDRLLGSPHYGERMAQHWLDVVRYADTVGFHGDQNHNAWAYRDWVIAAFNENKRFDVFTREQLAGDLLPNPTESQWTATCFNRLTMMTREGGAQPGEYLAKYTADRVRTVSMAWMGATLGCAECHDHKFDPWTQKDFYSLGAFFADVKQWGVYNDYSYTPNPDLKGWSNDHPFPPERVVESAALKRRMESLTAEKARVLAEAAASAGKDPAKIAGYPGWEKAVRAFLSVHPAGWETPVPEVDETNALPRKGKGKARAATATAATTPPVEETTVESDGRIVFASGGARHAEITLPVSGTVSAVSLEMTAHPKHHNSIARTGHSVTLKPSFYRKSADGKTHAIEIRYADANLKRVRYANGFDVLGIEDGWTSKDGSAHVLHRGVWIPAEPVTFAPGETLLVVLADNLAGCVRVSVSPVITSIGSLETAPVFSGAVGKSLYLMTTPGHEVRKAVHALDLQIRECRGGRTPVMVTERAAKPLTIRVLPRGNWQDENGALCSPVTPAFLPREAQPEPTRLGLANWLTARTNPLTARVIMNRLWRQLFGTGLSAQTDDLGAQGEAPSHPELLDWLAAEFMESGWDFKHMVRLIVNSHTYRQASLPRAETRDADPMNRWLASQNARRLEAEAVRDNALAISGLLSLEMGGPPVHPYQPPNYYEGLQFPDREYKADAGIDQWRRGVYTHWQRTFLQPMLANFDAPSREDCVALRTQANTPQQALTLLNDPTFLEAARVWAVEIIKAGDDAARLEAAFQKALYRRPSAKERTGLLSFLNRMRTEYKARPDDAAKLLTTGFAPKPDAGTDKVELAAWTSVCRVMLNLHETITRY